MRKYLKATEDASIYEAYPNINTGFDEILEVGKVRDTVIYGEPYVSSSARALLNFDLSDSASWPTSSVQYFLNLRIAYADEVTHGQELIVGHISESWTQGSGYFYQEPRNSLDGATWNQKDQLTSWSLAGASLLTSPTASVELTSFPIEDVYIDVTTVVSPIVSASGTFNGLYVKIPDADEQSSLNRGVIKFFSTQTHTIYQPTLEVAWDSQQFVTGSLSVLPESGYFISADVNSSYVHGSVQKVRFVSRPKFPDRRFDAIKRYSNKYYLPQQSYYRVVDVSCGTVYGVFDAYNAVDCDASGSYVTIDTAPLYKKRQYRIELEINFDNGVRQYYHVPQTFRVI